MQKQQEKADREKKAATAKALKESQDKAAAAAAVELEAKQAAEANAAAAVAARRAEAAKKEAKEVAADTPPVNVDELSLFIWLLICRCLSLSL